MSSSQDGYIVDVPYPTFVHRQTTPLWLNMIVQSKGFCAPNLVKPYRYLELGCAMGIHLHLTAAANPLGHFIGVDFNQQQLMVAQEGLEITEIDNIEFIQASFEEFLNYELEPFDFIVTHGVWSWISPENQNIVAKIIDKLLKKDGVLYCSYMSHPGATSLISVQKLMLETSKNLQGDSASKAVQSLNLVRQIGAAKSGLFEKISGLNQELSELAQDKPNYIAHDFLSEHWQPQHSADMIQRFGELGLSYVGGAGIIENLDKLSLPPEVQKILKTLPLITLQETVKDIARYTLQRQDIYVKDRTQLNKQQLENYYSTVKFGILPSAPLGKDLSLDPKVGRIKDAIKLFEQILVLLDKQVLSTLELSNRLKHNLSLKQLTEILLVLVWAGYIHPCQHSETKLKFEKAMNKWMLDQQLGWSCLTKYGTAIQI
ncbi:class I SAM-dependent methyltransferase [Acinetobacter haemolyticus]|uniref:class I SAM-dependent methyltransferase n=2 Tax=Acinetobacter haemolyticus TaxID=29430 RepID=UPI0021CD7CD0|nr:class I SAM-dependent methyltransferase [Acinetobacter haemolyticus]MCU4378373.1 methyltransferase regulatory domain-containing protein [Acinetobacter haemolyticus]